MGGQGCTAMHRLDRKPAAILRCICWHCLKETRATAWSGAVLSHWPVEPQGLHKQNKTWGCLEIFRLMELSRGSLRVSVSQKQRADQRPLRVSKPQPHLAKRNKPHPRCLLCSASQVTNLSSMLNGLLLVRHKRSIEL